MQEAFEKWLREYKDHKYTEGTVKRYIRALQKAEEWLDITLPKKVLSVDNLEEFLRIQSIIKNTTDYDVINQSHGHGDLSAALKAYERFMQPDIPKAEIKEPQELKAEDNGVIDIIYKDVLAEIENYILARGFDYPDGLIENFYLSLKSKPFVILAGTSGTGKTRLVKLFAEAIGAEYKLVSVRPDWSDGSDLFGHYDLNGKFIDGSVCECFEMAYADPNKPVFLCLDEMNLARVEYYLSDFLSVIESREKNSEGKIVTAPIAQYKEGIPDNLYIVGTVNMDETTFPFSKKVLDRANTIEFSYVDLMPDFDSVAGEQNAQNVDNNFLRSDRLVLVRDCADEKEYVTDICRQLEALNSILRKANAHVGYRVRDEIVFYMLNNKKAELLDEGQALDNEIMQKILPRIQGSSAAIKTLLIELYQFCKGDRAGIDTEDAKIGERMRDSAENALYPASAEKIGYMMTRFEEDGFTSYWL